MEDVKEKLTFNLSKIASSPAVSWRSPTCALNHQGAKFRDQVEQ